MKKYLLLPFIAALALMLTGCPDVLGSNEDNESGADPDLTTGAAPTAPVFSLEPGQYVGAQSLTLTTDTEGASIYYRLDFGTPDSSDQEYTGAVTVEATTHMSAVAIKDGVSSGVTYRSFAIRESGYTNQVVNGAFTAGTDGWWMWVNGDEGAAASWTTTDGDNDGDDELAITIQSGGSRGYHVQPFFPVGFPTKEGELYELSFTAWVDDAGSAGFRPLVIAVDENGEDVDGDGNRFDTFFWQPEFITETPRTFSKRIAIYVSPDHEHPRTRLALNLGTENGIEAGGTVYIDDVSLELVETPESFDTVVTSAAMRTAFMAETIPETEDRGGQRRFENLSESEITAYHLAAVRGLEMSNDAFEDAGLQVGDFDLSTVDLTKFGGLDYISFDDLPVTNTDITALSAVTSLRDFDVGNSTGDSGSFTGITNISPIADLRVLRYVQFQENNISVSNLTSTITPANFPSLVSLELGLVEADPTAADVDSIIDTFESFVDAGNEFHGVAIENTPISDAQFTTLFNNVLSPSSSTLEDFGIGGWSNPGSLSDTILSSLGTLTELRGLQLHNQQLTTLDGLESLSTLEYLEAADMSTLTDFSALASLANLEELEIYATGFDQDDWVSIAGLSNLQFINMRGTETLRVTGDNGSVGGDEMDDFVTALVTNDPALFSSGGTLELGTFSTFYEDGNLDSINALQGAGINLDYEVDNSFLN